MDEREWVDFNVVMLTIEKELYSLDSIDDLKLWLQDGKFTAHIQQELAEHDLIHEETSLIRDRLDILDDLVKALTKFEVEFKDYQVNKFKQLELLRFASDLVGRVRGTQSNGFVSDINPVGDIETRQCNYPPCGKVFVADPPTKHYCSEKCREKAKKWRKRRTDGQQRDQ